MGLMQDKGIELINRVINGYNHKVTNGIDPDMGFISCYKNISSIDRILNEIDLTISGSFNIDESSISTDDGGVAFITPLGIEFWDVEVENVVGICPLSEFRELLVEWKSFLQTPPLHGAKID